jgi:hypothetical protein
MFGGSGRALHGGRPGTLLRSYDKRARAKSVVCAGRSAAFTAKLKDIVGLYVDPPAHAVVLSIDEESQIQALDRTQPGLPMKEGARWQP